MSKQAAHAPGTSRSLDDPRVAMVPARYPDGAAPEQQGAALIPAVLDPMRLAVRAIGDRLGWSSPDAGAFGAVIPPDARVVVKPNWVLHENQGSGGFTPLVTHGTLIRAVVAEALASRAGHVLVGDAPVQGCDFDALLRNSDIGAWGERLIEAEPRFGGIVDFRRRTLIGDGPARDVVSDRRGMEHFVLFDVAGESLLEPITVDGAFRVTMYDPSEMRRTHAPGRHQYLVAREILDADVILNLPKLKTHKKAGVTCALKNLIGINGNKEFLPHHRVGGSEVGGDCYPGRSTIKRALEHVHDVRNSVDGRVAQHALSLASRALNRAALASGDRLGVEGSWSGNDTIWRTCLDLNRILLYGRSDGTIADQPQREVLNVVDAVIAGQGDGPLSPQSLPLGLLLGGSSSAAIDWVGALLLGYEPRRIPITAHAFDAFRWPIARFRPEDVRLVDDAGEVAAVAASLPSSLPRPSEYPLGWMDAVATDDANSRRTG